MVALILGEELAILYHFDWFRSHASQGLWSWLNLVTCPTSQPLWPMTFGASKKWSKRLLKYIYGCGTYATFFSTYYLRRTLIDQWEIYLRGTHRQLPAYGVGRGGGVGQGLSKLKKLAGYQCLWAKDEEKERKRKKATGREDPNHTISTWHAIIQVSNPQKTLQSWGNASSRCFCLILRICMQQVVQY